MAEEEKLDEKLEKKGLLRRFKDWFSKKFVIGAFALTAGVAIGAEAQDVEASPQPRTTNNLRQVEVAEPKIPGATPEEIAKIKAINQQKHNLRIQKIEAMQNHDESKVQEISARLIQLDMQSNAVLAPIRQRQAELEVDKNSKVDPEKIGNITTKEEVQQKVNPNQNKIKHVPDTLTDNIKVDPKSSEVATPEEVQAYLNAHRGQRVHLPPNIHAGLNKMRQDAARAKAEQMREAQEDEEIDEER